MPAAATFALGTSTATIRGPSSLCGITLGHTHLILLTHSISGDVMFFSTNVFTDIAQLAAVAVSGSEAAFVYGICCQRTKARETIRYALVWHSRNSDRDNA